MSDQKNKIIGGFKVLQEIQAGSGSQGTVYKAECVEDLHGVAPVGTVVAMKVMAVVQDEGQEKWRRLEKRTKELAKLDHPNVVKYYGCFSEQGMFNDVHVVVQEFLQGETMKERLLRFPCGLDADEALEIVNKALAGLAYTASCGLVHRDIKPGNIFICLDDEGKVTGVKLIDFEIAKQEGGTVTTADGNIRGSFDYMAPDFTNAEFHGDTQSDVFSMGVVLHEALTGKTPYQRLEGGDKQANFAFLSRWSQTLSDPAAESPIHVSSRVKRLLSKADGVLLKALAPRREDRYKTFEEFRMALKDIRFRDLVNGESSYRMLQFIGKGGFGEVFKARYRQTGALVAVKHLLKADYADRFYREAKIMKKLRDPCFVQFVDFFVMEGRGSKEAFLVMAFLDGMPGSSLRDAIKAAHGQPLPFSDALRAFERYALGLKVMHDEGIFHRDIKPSNLYYPQGKPHLAAIMDLGIARDVNGTATHGMVPGTLDYMPPEVVISDSRGDGGMDIYALGLCLYEALSGKMAYPRLPTGTAAYAAFFNRAKAKEGPKFDYQPLTAMPDLMQLLVQMTNLDPAKRLKDAGEVAARLHDIRAKYHTIDFTESNGPETSPTEWIGVDLKAIRRERRAVAMKKFMRRAAIFLVVAAVCGVGVYFGAPVVKEYLDKRGEEQKKEILARDAEAMRLRDEMSRQLEEQKAKLEAERKAMEEAAARRKAEEARLEAERKAKEEELRKEAEERERQMRELEQKQREFAEAQAKAKAEAAAREKAEAERQRKAAEEAEKERQRLEAERLAREKAAADALASARDDAERQRIAEENAKRQEAARKAEEVRLRKAAEEAQRLEAERKAAEEARLKKEREEFERKLAEMQKLLAAQEEARKRAEEEAKKRAEEAEKAEKAAKEAEEARKKYEAEQAEARKREEERQRQLKEAEAKRLAEQQAQDEEIRKAAEEARQKAIEEARRKAAEEARIAEEKRLREEAERLERERKAAAAEAARKAAEKAERERQEALRKQKEAAGRGLAFANEANEFFEFEDYGECVKKFHAAMKAGYSVTEQDMEKIQKSFDERKANLDNIIDLAYKNIAKGKSVHRDVQANEEERSSLITMYRELRKAAGK